MKILGMALSSLLVASISGGALAQTSPPLTEQNLERGLVNLGLMAGHAFQCMPEADRPAAQGALLAFNSLLIAQMGSNAAFRFATSFGAGSSHEVDRSYCERSLADWRRHVQQHRLDR
ncbi:hypothetical protein [Sediminicoccus sp. BL-A-41-H5]|uniref:hypothetical protein n=1 Tax=Sediminicoccus sp. BL-A-41-H5 TaxID=3421106 RepID=UPI003D67145B